MALNFFIQKTRNNKMTSKRKVGAVIIMRPNHNNYGTALQGYASIQVLKKLEYPFRIIRYNKKGGYLRKIKNLPGLLRTGALSEFLRRRKKQKFLKENETYAKQIKTRNLVVNEFKNTYFEPYCDYYDTYKDLEKGANNYDVIFVGSDQVWGPLSLYSGFYNLLFVDKSIPHFSYASSFGKGMIFDWQRKKTAEYLNRLNRIGVREIRGQEIVKELTGRDAEVVADPTMLLSRNDWDEVISKSNKKIGEPYILSYVLGHNETTRKTITELGRNLNLKVVSFPHMDNYEPFDCQFGDIQLFDADCLDFVNLIKNADYVCTDSFHCAVFSIIFHKKFLSFYRHSQSDKMSSNSRIDSLLSIFGLKERLFKSDLNAENAIDAEIDYERVDLILNDLRDKSMDFFKSCLEM